MLRPYFHQASSSNIKSTVIRQLGYFYGPSILRWKWTIILTKVLKLNHWKGVMNRWLLFLTFPNTVNQNQKNITPPSKSSSAFWWTLSILIFSIKTLIEWLVFEEIGPDNLITNYFLCRIHHRWSSLATIDLNQ